MAAEFADPATGHALGRRAVRGACLNHDWPVIKPGVRTVDDGGMTGMWAAFVAVLVLGCASVIVAALATPWRPLRADAEHVVAARIAGDFTDDEIERGARLHRTAKTPRRCAAAIDAVVTLGLGFSPLGSALVRAVAAPFGGGFIARALAGPIALVLLFTLIGLPFGAWRERVAHRFGLSVRTWRTWWADLGRGTSIGLVLVAGVAIAGYTLPRAVGDWWWAPAAAAAALLVALLSFVVPVLLEPLFNRFTPMPDSPLRDEVLALAARAGVRVSTVLVADASRRTTALNAYVSGLGATRRVVVYDTVVADVPNAEICQVVAHELGHARHRDVVWGTVFGCLGAATTVPLLALLLHIAALCHAADTPVGGTTPTSAPLVAALALLLGAVGAPVMNLVSRRIEARADVHALDLTADPALFARMQRRLAITNIAYLTPSRLAVIYQASHPPTAARIAMARTWARHHGSPEPGPLASG